MKSIASLLLFVVAAWAVSPKPIVELRINSDPFCFGSTVSVQSTILDVCFRKSANSSTLLTSDGSNLITNTFSDSNCQNLTTQANVTLNICIDGKSAVLVDQSIFGAGLLTQVFESANCNTSALFQAELQPENSCLPVDNTTSKVINCFTKTISTFDNSNCTGDPLSVVTISEACTSVNDSALIESVLPQCSNNSFLLKGDGSLTQLSNDITISLATYLLTEFFDSPTCTGTASRTDLLKLGDCVFNINTGTADQIFFDGNDIVLAKFFNGPSCFGPFLPNILLPGSQFGCTTGRKSSVTNSHIFPPGVFTETFPQKFLNNNCTTDQIHIEILHQPSGVCDNSQLIDCDTETLSLFNSTNCSGTPTLVSPLSSLFPSFGQCDLNNITQIFTTSRCSKQNLIANNFGVLTPVPPGPSPKPIAQIQTFANPTCTGTPFQTKLLVLDTCIASSGVSKLFTVDGINVVELEFSAGLSCFSSFNQTTIAITGCINGVLTTLLDSAVIPAGSLATQFVGNFFCGGLSTEVDFISPGCGSNGTGSFFLDCTNSQRFDFTSTDCSGNPTISPLADVVRDFNNCTSDDGSTAHITTCTPQTQLLDKFGFLNPVFDVLPVVRSVKSLIQIETFSSNDSTCGVQQLAFVQILKLDTCVQTSATSSALNAFNGTHFFNLFFFTPDCTGVFTSFNSTANLGCEGSRKVTATDLLLTPAAVVTTRFVGAGCTGSFIDTNLVPDEVCVRLSNDSSTRASCKNSRTDIFTTPDCTGSFNSTSFVDQFPGFGICVSNPFGSNISRCVATQFVDSFGDIADAKVVPLPKSNKPVLVSKVFPNADCSGSLLSLNLARADVCSQTGASESSKVVLDGNKVKTLKFLTPDCTGTFGEFSVVTTGCNNGLVISTDDFFTIPAGLVTQTFTSAKCDPKTIETILAIPDKSCLAGPAGGTKVDCVKEVLEVFNSQDCTGLPAFTFPIALGFPDYKNCSALPSFTPSSSFSQCTTQDVILDTTGETSTGLPSTTDIPRTGGGKVDAAGERTQVLSVLAVLVIAALVI